MEVSEGLSINFLSVLPGFICFISFYLLMFLCVLSVSISLSATGKASFHPCGLDLKSPEKKCESSEIQSSFFWDPSRLYKPWDGANFKKRNFGDGGNLKNLWAWGQL